MIPPGSQDLDSLYAMLLVKNRFVRASQMPRLIRQLKIAQNRRVNLDLSMFLLERRIISVEQHRTILEQMRKSEGRPASPKTEQPLCNFGPFKVLRKVAIGAMGAIFQVRDTRNGRILALKSLLKGTAAEINEIRRFKREALCAKKIDHPGVVSVHEVGRYQGIWFMTMDYIEGCSLEEFMATERLSISEAVRIAAEIAEALDCIHQAGIIHRDIKPDNILLDKRVKPPKPKITDFSLAMWTDPRILRLTQTGSTVGTPYYMAPEQTLGERSKIDARTDIYGLGVMLFEMLTGRVPFMAESIPSLYLKIQRSPAPSLVQFNPNVDGFLETIVLKALEKSPELRYQRAAEMARDLQAYRQDKPLLVTRAGWLQRKWDQLRRHPPQQLLLALLVLLITVVIILLIHYIGWKLPQKRRRLQARALFSQGCDWQARQNYHRALKSFRQAWALDPGLGGLQLRIKQVRQALKRYQHKQQQALIQQALHQLRNGDMQGSLALVHAAQQQLALPCQSDQQLAQALQALEHGESQVFWQRLHGWQALPSGDHLASLSRHLDDPLVRGASLLILGVPRLALPYLFQVTKTYDTTGFARFLQGKALIMSGQWEKGRALLQRFEDATGAFAPGQAQDALLLFCQQAYVASYNLAADQLQRQPGSIEARLSLGLIYNHFQCHALAVQQLDDLVRRYPNFTALYYYRGRFKMQARDFQGARRDLEKVASDLNLSVPVLLALGQIARTQGQKLTALRYFQRVLSQAPHHLPALLALARLHLAAHKNEEALKYLRTVLRIKPACGEAHLILGKFYLTNDQLHLAADHARQALAHPALAGSASYCLARIYRDQQHFVQAGYFYDQALAYQPDQAAFHLERLRFYLDQQWYFRACYYLRQPEYVKVCRSWSRTLRQLIHNAGQKLDQAIAQEPVHSALYLKRIWLSLALGQLEAAQHDLKKLVTLSNNRAVGIEAQLARAVMQCFQRRYSHALANLNKALVNLPVKLQARAYFFRSCCHWARQHFKAAARDCRQVLQCDPAYLYHHDFLQSANRLAAKLAQQGQRLAALELLQNISLRCPANPFHERTQAYVQYASLLALQGAYAQGRQELQQALRTDPQWRYAYLYLGEFYERYSRETQTAIRVYRFALQLAQARSHSHLAAKLRSKIRAIKALEQGADND